jgi:hypothetical protein
MTKLAIPTSRVMLTQNDGTPCMPPMPITTAAQMIALVTLLSSSLQQPLYPPFLSMPLLDLLTTWTYPLTPLLLTLPHKELISISLAPMTPMVATTLWRRTVISQSNVIAVGTREVERGLHGALSASGRLTPLTLMKGGATPLRPASDVGALMSVDSTLHVESSEKPLRSQRV